jgi:CheY-like chemotaxis protein
MSVARQTKYQVRTILKEVLLIHYSFLAGSMAHLSRAQISQQSPESANSAGTLPQDFNGGNTTGVQSSLPSLKNAKARPGAILCIDDEPKGLAVRKILLESQGYEVLTATSGREGLALFAHHRIPAVVLDYAMPEMNGAEVAAAIKRLDSAVKILLFSAYVDLPKEELRWVDAYAVKGVNPKAFFAAVQQLFVC